MTDKILLQVSENILKLINYWESKGKLPKLKWPKQDENGLFINPSNRFKDTTNLLKSLLEGTFLIDKSYLAEMHEVDNSKKFTEQDIMQSIERFYVCVTNQQYFPEKKDFVSKLSLSQFIWNYHANNVKFQSWFLYCYTTASELLCDRARKHREARAIR